MRTPKARRSTQLPLPLRTWGGARTGAGRKRRTNELPHTTRPALDARKPLHVTVRIRSGLPSLREQALLAKVRAAFTAARERFGARLVHYSVQRDHLHLILEARDRRALGRAMRGLGVRVARGLNGLLRTTGRVIGDRYHARALATPREVRNALRYVLLNARRHGRDVRFDRASSAAAFDGWSRRAPALPERELAAIEGSVAPASVWLLTVGWRRHGLLDPSARPGPAPRARQMAPAPISADHASKTVTATSR